MWGSVLVTFLVQNKLGDTEQQPVYYGHDFWNLEFRQGTAKMGPQMRRPKGLGLAHMLEAGIIQRCLHSDTGRLALAGN